MRHGQPPCTVVLPCCCPVRPWCGRPGRAQPGLGPCRCRQMAPFALGRAPHAAALDQQPSCARAPTEGSLNSWPSDTTWCCAPWCLLPPCTAAASGCTETIFVARRLGARASACGGGRGGARDGKAGGLGRRGRCRPGLRRLSGGWSGLCAGRVQSRAGAAACVGTFGCVGVGRLGTTTTGPAHERSRKRHIDHRPGKDAARYSYPPCGCAAAAGGRAAPGR